MPLPFNRDHMKTITLIFSAILAAFSLASCKTDCIEPACSIEATLISKSFDCLGYGIITEHGDTLIALSYDGDGNDSPITQLADSLEEGDTFFIDYEEPTAAWRCSILPHPPFNDAEKVWVNCLTGPCFGENCN